MRIPGRPSFLLATCLLFLISSNGFSQDWRQAMMELSLPYDSICQLADDFFDADPRRKEGNGDGYKDYLRFRHFWQDRWVPSDDYQTYHRELAREFQLGATCIYGDQGGSNWESMGPNKYPTLSGFPVNSAGSSCNGPQSSKRIPTGQGLVQSIWVDPSHPNQVFAGSNSGGLWKTVDGGQHWAHSSSAQRYPGMGIQEIVVNPFNTSEMWVATGNTAHFGTYGVGVLKSIDGGAQWAPTALSYNPTQLTAWQQRQVFDLAYDPYRPLFQYAVTDDSLFYTHDGWATMAGLGIPVQSIGGNLNVRYLEVVPDTGLTGWNTILVSGSGFWVASPNGQGGLSVAEITPNLPIFNKSTLQIARARADVDTAWQDTIYVCYQDHDTDSVGPKRSMYTYLAKSSDLGQTWTIIDSASECYNRASSIPFEFEVSPVDPTRFYVGGIVVIRFMPDSGSQTVSWGVPSIPQYMHDDIRDLKVFNNGNGKDLMYAAHDGGVSVSTNSGESWTWLNGSGLELTQFYGIDVEEDVDNTGGGCIDIGVVLHRNGEWYSVDNFYGDGGNFIYTNDESEFISMSNVGVRGFTGFGAGLDQINPGYINPPDTVLQLEDIVSMDAPIQRHPTLTRDFYVGIENINYFKFPMQIFGWTRMSFLGNKKVRAMKVAPSNTDVIYFSAQQLPQNGKALFRTTDGAQDSITSWTDLSANVPGVDIIRAIEVHPTDPSRVWIGFNRFTDSAKVYYSSDTGNTWTNWSAGLPNFPVMDILYVPDSPDLLFVGTDVGVYYRDAGMTQWECFSKNLPNVMITDLELNRCRGKLRAGTYGRGLYETDLPVIHHTLVDPVVIWDTDTTIHDIVRVKSGHTLDITPGVTVSFSEQAGLIVGKRARLTVDGATLTALSCAASWRGIEVEGDQWASQFPVNNSAQGLCHLKGGAVVEHARVAVSVWDGDDQFTGGGILFADSAIFRNNHQGVDFGPYHPIVSGNPQHNVSRLNNCVFTNTSAIKDVSKFNAFVDLHQVWGVTIAGCDFTNESLSLFPADVLRGYGIRSQSSYFRIEPICNSGLQTCPPAAIDSCHFENLYYGFEHSAMVPVHTGVLDHAVFTNNVRGAVISGADYAQVTHNTFEMHNADADFGLNMRYSSNYGLYNNEFKGTYGANQAIGLYVRNSGPEPNLVNSNSFENLFAGAIFNDFNDGPDPNDGLFFQCNSLDTTLYDVAVIANNPLLKAKGDIAFFQGVCQTNASAANNQFSEACDSANNSHFFVDKISTQEIHYAHFIGDEPHCPDPSNIVLQNCAVPNPNGSAKCPGFVIDTNSTSEKRQILVGEKEILDSLEMLIDGGNTAWLMTYIAQDPRDSELTDTLKKYSPYLSDAVLLSITSDKPTSYDLDSLKYILEQHVPLNNIVRESVAARDSNILANLDLYVLENGVTNSSRFLLESEIARHAVNRQSILDALIRSFLHGDSLSGIDSAKTQLELENNLAANQNCLALLWCKGEVSGAQAAMNSFAPLEDSNWLDFRTVNQLLINALSDSNGVFVVENDAAILADLANVVESENDAGQEVAQAQAIQQLVLGNIPSLNVQRPETLPSPRINVEAKSFFEKNRSSKIKVWPNPAGSWLQIESETSLKNGQLSLFDLTGKLWMKSSWPDGSKQHRLNTRDLAGGLYLVVVLAEDGPVGHSRVAIVRE